MRRLGWFNKHVFLRGAWCAIAAAVCFFAITAGICWYGSVNSAMTADVAVVLGNKVHADGRVHKRLAARLDAAVQVYREKRCRAVIVSGGKGKSGYDEATAMARYLVGKGVPMRDVVLDHNGVNTWETAKFTSEYML